MKTDFIIKNLYIVEQNDPVVTPMHRGYSMKADTRTVNNLQETLNRFGAGSGQVITEAALSHACPELMKISGTTAGGVKIPYGWNQKRLSFVLELSRMASNIKEELHYIQGYTDYYEPLQFLRDGMSIAQIISPEIKFTVNSMAKIELISDSEGNVHTKVKYKTNVIKAYDVSDGFSELDTIDTNIKKSRPVDIVEDVYLSKINNHKNQQSIKQDTVGNDAETSSRRNNSPIAFATSIINNTIIGADANNEQNQFATRHSQASTLQNVSVGLAEVNITENPLLYYLYVNKLSDGTYFTINDLLGIDLDLDHKSTFFSIEKMRATKELTMNKLHNDLKTGGYSPDILTNNELASTAQPNIENLKTTELMNYVISILSENFLSSCIMYISNDPSEIGLSEAGQCRLLHVGSIYNEAFVSIDVSRSIENYGLNVILPAISDNDETIVDCLISVDLITTTTASIKVNMGDKFITRYNTSADGLFSPSIADAATKAALVNDVAGLTDLVIDVSGPNKI